MIMYWPKPTIDKIKKRIIEPLNTNVNYRKNPIPGISATYIDAEVLYEDAPFPENIALSPRLIAAPNRVGCQTLNGSEKIFKHRQELKKELIKLCAEEIFEDEPDIRGNTV